MTKKILRSLAFFYKYEHKLFLLLFFILLIPVLSFARQNNLKGITNSDIIVGNRTGNTTATISIDNGSIQQSILSTVPYFNNYTITSEEATISVDTDIKYLLFKVKTPLGDTANVAVELIQVQNNVLVFRPHSYLEIFMYVSYGNCSDCTFLRDWKKAIIGCSPALGSNQSTGCKYSVVIAQ